MSSLSLAVFLSDHLFRGLGGGDINLKNAVLMDAGRTKSNEGQNFGTDMNVIRSLGGI